MSQSDKDERAATRLLEEAFRKNCRACNGDAWTCKNVGSAFDEPCVAYNVRVALAAPRPESGALFRDELLNLLERREHGMLDDKVFSIKVEGVLKAIRSTPVSTTQACSGEFATDGGWDCSRCGANDPSECEIPFGQVRSATQPPKPRGEEC
jgi:hypothetical protein